MNSGEVVSNLRIMSETLSRIANKPDLYNTEYGYFLEQFSYQLHKDANDLIQIESLLGMSNAINIEV